MGGGPLARRKRLPPFLEGFFLEEFFQKKRGGILNAHHYHSLHSIFCSCAEMY